MRRSRFKDVLFPIVMLLTLSTTSLFPYIYALNVPTTAAVSVPASSMVAKKPTTEKPKTNVVNKPKPKPPATKITKRPKSIPNRVIRDEELEQILSGMDLGNLTPDLVRSVIYYESTFRTGVVSHRNAIGLMGIRATTETGKVVWLKKLIEAGIIKVETDLYRPANNIEAGVFILNTYYDLHNGDMKKVLRNYIGSSTLATKYMKGVPDDGRE